MTSPPADHSPTPETEWTHVGRKRRPGSLPQSLKDPVLGTRPASQLSASEIKHDHGVLQKQWLDSRGCRSLQDLISTRIGHVPVSNAICLGLGSFDPDDGSWQAKKRTHVQLAAFATAVAASRQQGKQDIKCYFQEPCFTPGDKEFLRGFGYEVVESPIGFDLVSENSLVFGIHLYRDIYSKAIAQCIPAIFIGTDHETWEE